jgi:RNA polymerase sigma-70 factor (ECF subfamily)
MSSSEHHLAFERLVRPHLDRLYRLAWRLTGAKDEAEDLFQELLTRAFTKLDDLVEIDEPGPWLCRVMYNLFIDERRRFTRQRLHVVDEGSLPGEGLAGMAGPDDPAENHARGVRLRRLDAALALHDTEGYKLTEIHELTGIPVGTLKSRLSRARARLREMLEADGTFS